MQSSLSRRRNWFRCLCWFVLLGAALAAGNAGRASRSAVSQAGTWATQSSGVPNTLSAVHFLNDTEGWAAGNETTLLHTSNGGAVWTAVTNTGVVSSRGFNAVRMIDQNTIWAGGDQAVIRTTNGGASWGGLQFTSTTTFRYDLFPVSASVAWAVGFGPCGPFTGRILFRYTFNPDNSVTTFSTCDSSFSALRAVYFVNADNGWAVGVGGQIVRITNATAGSPTVTGQTSGTTQALWDVHFADLNTGWATGDGGVILKTTNSGSNWSAQTSGTTTNLRDLYALNANEVWAVGENGLVLHTTDGGNVWTAENSGVTDILRGSAFPSASTGYAVGNSGRIIKRSTCPVIALTPTAGALPAGTQGTAYSQNLTASGGTPSYTFSVSAGSLPPGLSLSTGGALTGTPTTPGNYAFTIQATDAAGCAGLAAYTLAINCPAITLNPATLPNGTVNTLYGQTLTPSGGTAPYTCSLSAGTLPAGITLSNCQLSGTPTAIGTSNFTIGLTDANNCPGTQPYSLTIQPNNTPPTISAVAVVRQQGSPASNSIIANVSDPDQAANTLAVTVNSGTSATVNGITVSGISVSAGGVVTANVIAACTATAANFTLTVTDASSATANAMLTVTVTANNAPLLAYTGPQNVLVGGALNVVPNIGLSDNGSVSSLAVQSITPSGFTGTITVNSFGVVAISNAGPANDNYTVTIRATDNCGATTDVSFRLVVNTQACTGIGFIQPAGSPVAVGNTPLSMAVGDFNQDGKSDLAVANRNSNDVTILLGNGSGGFTPSASSPVVAGGFPVSVAVGDFNLDGKPDLVVAISSLDQVMVLLGDGSGGFAQSAGSPLSVGDFPDALAITDFNLDGKPDIAVASGNSGDLTVLLGNGGGGFSQPAGSPISAGSTPIAVASSDFNLDGKPDLAVANANSNNVTILIGNGSGGFSPSASSPLNVVGDPRYVTAGDFNLDNKPDLAIANAISNNVTIFLGNGSGGFTQPVGSPITIGSLAFVAAVGEIVGDFNLDGKPDLAVGGVNVTILLGNGSGGFSQPIGSPIAAGTDPVSVAIGDFNLDGKPDLATGNATSNNVTILLNSCTNTPPTIAATPSNSRSASKRLKTEGLAERVSALERQQAKMAKSVGALTE